MALGVGERASVAKWPWFRVLPLLVGGWVSCTPLGLAPLQLAGSNVQRHHSNSKPVCVAMLSIHQK